MWMLLYNPPKRARDLGPKSAWNRRIPSRRKDHRLQCCDYISAEKTSSPFRGESEKKKFRTKWLHKLCLVESSDFFAVANRSETLLRVFWLVIGQSPSQSKQHRLLSTETRLVTLRAGPSSRSGGVNRKYPEEKDGYIIRHTYRIFEL